VRSSHGQRGFTLVELLVVLAIVGILNTLSLQAGMQCLARTRQAVAQMTERFNQLALEAANGGDCAARPAGAVEPRCE
jgi:prepilin-type N-terminal cleavage/methylation domain-containing protein